ncbi:hypothetical protein Tco_1497905 [Tanacetum coccineum]
MLGGTPPDNVIFSAIPRALPETEQPQKDSQTVAIPVERRAGSAKRSLHEDLSLEAKKRKTRIFVVAVSRSSYVYVC